MQFEIHSALHLYRGLQIQKALVYSLCRWMCIGITNGRINFFSLYIYIFYDVEEKNECINCNVRLEMDSRVKQFKIVSLHTKWIRLHFKLENLCQELKRPNSTKRLHWFSIQFRIEVKMKAKKNSEFVSYRFEWWFIEIRCTDVSAA